MSMRWDCVDGLLLPLCDALAVSSSMRTEWDVVGVGVAVLVVDAPAAITDLGPSDSASI